MTKSDYAKYTQSAEWKELRNEYINEQGGSCERCGLPRWLAELLYDQDVHVHHTSYAHRETDAEFQDLETLCRRCHEVETFGRSELKKPKEAKCTCCGATHWDYRSEFCTNCLFLAGNDPTLWQTVGRFHPGHGEVAWKALMRMFRIKARFGEMDFAELIDQADITFHPSTECMGDALKGQD